MKEIQWRDPTPESVRQTGTPSAAKENLRLHGVAYTPMTANKHTTLFDGGVMKLLNLYPDIRSRAAEPNGTMHAGHTAHQGQPYCL